MVGCGHPGGHSVCMYQFQSQTLSLHLCLGSRDGPKKVFASFFNREYGLLCPSGFQVNLSTWEKRGGKDYGCEEEENYESVLLLA